MEYRVLNITDNSKKTDLIPITIESAYNSFEVTISLDGKKVIDVLNDINLFQESYKKNEIIADSANEEDIDYNVEIEWANLLNNLDKKLYYYDYIRFNSKKELIRLIGENPELKDKNILINGNFSIKVIKNILKKYEDLKDLKIYFNLLGNSKPVDIETCRNTINYIENVANYVKELNLSQYETIIFVYDIVRDRVYKKESETEEAETSRDLSKIINDSPIVCVGYSVLFEAILSYLDIDCKETKLLSKEFGKHGHARNEIKINDDKYNIKGLYYFDTTWDSKKDESDKKFLYSYKYFGKTRDEMEKLEKYKFNYVGSHLYSFDFLEDFRNNYNNVSLNDKINYFNVINFVLESTGRKKILVLPNFLIQKLNVNEIIERVKDSFEEFNKTISAEVNLRAFDYVRSIQNQIDNEKYPYSNGVLYNLLINSGWTFEHEHLNSEQRLLNIITGVKTNNTLDQNFNNFMENGMIDDEFDFYDDLDDDILDEEDDYSDLDISKSKRAQI